MMDEKSRSYRARVLDEIEFLSNPSAQVKYERDVPMADVPAELICGFVDDLYHPKSELFLDAFSADESASLAELHGMLCVAARAFDKMNECSIQKIQKMSEWRAVMDLAKDLTGEMDGNS